jgi:hypothetical protein
MVSLPSSVGVAVAEVVTGGGAGAGALDGRSNLDHRRVGSRNRDRNRAASGTTGGANGVATPRPPSQAVAGKVDVAVDVVVDGSFLRLPRSSPVAPAPSPFLATTASS